MLSIIFLLSDAFIVTSCQSKTLILNLFSSELIFLACFSSFENFSEVSLHLKSEDEKIAFPLTKTVSSIPMSSKCVTKIDDFDDEVLNAIHLGEFL